MRLCRHSCAHVLVAIAFLACRLRAQEKPVPYGANAAAGHYLQVPGARIYYETYGNGGTPLVLLHGGLYGYIDEFGDLIKEMSQHRKVIAIASRGHGRSEIGTQPFAIGEHPMQNLTFDFEMRIHFARTAVASEVGRGFSPEF